MSLKCFWEKVGDLKIRINKKFAHLLTIYNPKKQLHLLIEYFNLVEKRRDFWLLLKREGSYMYMEPSQNTLQNLLECFTRTL